MRKFRRCRPAVYSLLRASAAERLPPGGQGGSPRGVRRRPARPRRPPGAGTARRRRGRRGWRRRWPATPGGRPRCPAVRRRPARPDDHDALPADGVPHLRRAQPEGPQHRQLAPALAGRRHQGERRGRHDQDERRHGQRAGDRTDAAQHRHLVRLPRLGHAEALGLQLLLQGGAIGLVRHLERHDRCHVEVGHEVLRARARRSGRGEGRPRCR